MKTAVHGIGLVWAVVIAFMVILPSVSYASDDLTEMEGLIKDISKSQSSPERIRNFEDKLSDTFYDTDPAILQAVIKDFAPGDALALLLVAKISGKGAKEVISAQKAGLAWDKLAEKFNVKIEDVVKGIKKFRRNAC